MDGSIITGGNGMELYRCYHSVFISLGGGGPFPPLLHPVKAAPLNVITPAKA